MKQFCAKSKQKLIIMKKQTFIKDLKQAKKNIGVKSEYICCTLSKEKSVELFCQYKPMAKDYAPEYWRGTISWWSWDNEQDSYVIAEKKRFLTDLIQKVEKMTDKEWNSTLVILKEK